MTVLKTGHNCMGIYRAHRTGAIIDARDYYRAFYHTARQARRYIIMAGWQFDSEVRLLRGDDADQAPDDVRLLQFLEALCHREPELEVYILAWDFSVFFTMEREWFQDVIFNWSAHERINFRYDDKHAFGATHHQKLVIIDGQVAFVGGMDICSDRWDDRRHLPANPERMDTEIPFGPYHDIQSYHTGPVVAELVALFCRRWSDAGAGSLKLPRVAGEIRLNPAGLLPLPTGRVAVSRTRALNTQPQQREIHEIRHLFEDAIDSAERLIYLENQYFSSEAVLAALVERMRAADRPRLQIIMILPDRLPFTEELFLGLPQMKMLRALAAEAQETGHRLGVFSTAGITGGIRNITFIHSKLLVVDDRFLTIGSANLTNRSMGLDTELNVSWEADPAVEPDLVAAIRGIRCSLLAEHAGLHNLGWEDRFTETGHLVDFLETLADDPETRLCRYAPEPTLENSEWSDALEPVSRGMVDPETPVLEQFISQKVSKYRASAFARGIRLLKHWIAGV